MTEPADARPNFRVERDDGVTVFTALGPQIVAEVKEELYGLAARLAEAPGPRHAVLDLGAVRQVNSAAIGILINFQKRVRDAGGALKVCQADPHVAEVFRLTKMDQVLDIHPSRSAAIASFRGPAPAGPAPGGGGGSWFSRLFGSR